MIHLQVIGAFVDVRYIISEGLLDDIEWAIYILAPFWLFTILLNIMSIVAEVRGTSKYATSESFVQEA